MAANIALLDPTNGHFSNSGAAVRANVATLTSGLTSKAITFSSAMPNTSFVVFANLVNTTDSSVQYQPVTPTAFSTTGFTASWNAPTDSANYVLHYIVMGYL